MALKSKIEWCDSTVNFWMGCSKVSPACTNCYAERWAKRCGRDFSKITRASGITFYNPIKWKKPKRIFVCSLSDFFHPGVYRADRHDAIKVMRDAPQHTYMLLTKRPELIRAQLAGTAWAEENGGLPKNVWLGVTAENQEQADKRIPALLGIPAWARFVSCEPLLSSIKMTYRCLDYLNDDNGIDWVVCGGESGSHARPSHPEWFRGLRDQCKEAGIPFLFKQWGEWGPLDLLRVGETTGRLRTKIEWNMTRWSKARAGHLLDGVEHMEIPEVK